MRACPQGYLPWSLPRPSANRTQLLSWELSQWCWPFPNPIREVESAWTVLLSLVLLVPNPPVLMLRSSVAAFALAAYAIVSPPLPEPIIPLTGQKKCLDSTFVVVAAPQPPDALGVLPSHGCVRAASLLWEFCQVPLS